MVLYWRNRLIESKSIRDRAIGFILSRRWGLLPCSNYVSSGGLGSYADEDCFKDGVEKDVGCGEGDFNLG